MDRAEYASWNLTAIEEVETARYSGRITRSMATVAYEELVEMSWSAFQRMPTKHELELCRARNERFLGWIKK